MTDEERIKKLEEIVDALLVKETVRLSDADHKSLIEMANQTINAYGSCAKEKYYTRLLKREAAMHKSRYENFKTLYKLKTGQDLE